MEEKEIMTYENEEEESEMMQQDDYEEYEDTERSGIGTPVAMLLGSALTVSVIAGVKGIKKWWANRKAKKEIEVSSAKVEVVEDSEDDAE